MSFDISVLNQNLESASTTSVFASLSDYPVRELLLAQVVRAELSNLRAGNAHTKMRGEVRGGGKKPWKQKGTGRARHGSSRSPIWVGGGITFGPRNTTNWHQKINKSSRVAALKSVIKDKLLNNAVSELAQTVSYQKTKEFTTGLTTFAETKGIKATKIAIIYNTQDKNNFNGVANTGVQLFNVNNLKISEMVNSRYFIFTESARAYLETRVA